METAEDCMVCLYRQSFKDAGLYPVNKGVLQAASWYFELLTIWACEEHLGWLWLCQQCGAGIDPDYRCKRCQSFLGNHCTACHEEADLKDLGNG